MSKIGIFSDPHLTKRIQEFSNEWESSVIKSFKSMYKTFKDNNVDYVICAGDFFDKATLEARSVPLVNEVRNIMSCIKTFLLLGNHEIDSNSHNILDAFLVEEEFIPVTHIVTVGNILFIPYNVDLDGLDKSMFKDKIIISHHDIYGSTLAGGKVKASFGYDPNIFNESEIVFNGHIHLRSKIGKVINVGSLFTSQFGEISDTEEDFPKYYIYDTETKMLDSFINNETLYFMTVTPETINKVSEDSYKDLNILLRVNYTDDESVKDIPDFSNVLKVIQRKQITSNDDVVDLDIRDKSSNIDIKSMISSYIDKDESVPEGSKSRIKDKCFSILEV